MTKRRVIIAVSAAVVALIAVLVVRTTQLSSRQISAPAPAEIAVDRAAIERLRAAVRIETISLQQRDDVDSSAFEAFHRLLRHSFAETHEALASERVMDLSALYTWRGSDETLPPLVLLAHMDVVPIANAAAWTAAPFSAEVRDGFVWGRGSMDDKGSLMAILEAVELLLAKRFKPKRTVYLAFGHDEEIGGRGAKAIAQRFKERGIKPHLVLDEGSLVVDGMVPGINGRVALLGITEKGYATMQVTAKSAGGHSSVPPRTTAAGKLARAVQRIESHPMPATLSGPVTQQMAFLAPEMPFGQRLAMANQWLFSPVIEKLYTRKPTTDALLRTTTAVTMLEGSIKENVLPSRATATVNFRIRPGDTVAKVRSHVEQLVAADDVEVRVLPGASDPPPVSPIDAPSFVAMQRTIAEMYPNAVFAPSLVVATTDARHWAGVADHVYRFLPLVLGPDDIKRFHGVDERISVEGYLHAIRFYARLIENVAGG